MRSKIKGVGTALTTFFCEQADFLDVDSLRKLINMQIEGGVDFLVPCGTTGESPTLSHEEHERIVSITVEIAASRVPVIAGTGSNSTAEAVSLTRAAKKAGADGCLVVEPYYNKPTPNGHYEYFSRVAEIGLPVILYTIEGRTARGVPTDIIIRLAQEGKIVGMKWASGNLGQAMEVRAGTPDDFSILSGDDNLTLALMAHGGDGVISVLSNLLPREMNLFMKFMLEERWKEAREMHYKLLPLMKAMFVETNPIPVKTAVSLVRHIGVESFRSPMCEMSEANRTKLIRTLTEHKLI